jgi:hypothetical protein
MILTIQITNESVKKHDDDDDDINLYKLQMRVLKNLHRMFPYRPVRKAFA